MDKIQLQHLRDALTKWDSVITSEMEERFNQRLIEILG